MYPNKQVKKRGAACIFPIIKLSIANLTRAFKLRKESILIVLIGIIAFTMFGKRIEKETQI